ncbi:MAG TPA: hypothetical protein VF598_05845 [Hymenobacter sp.]|jgi:hypothetical protein
METQGIQITLQRQAGQWTATAMLNGQFAGSATTKSKKFAEQQARQAAEHYQRQARPVGVGSLACKLTDLPEQASTLPPRQRFDYVGVLQVA